MKVKTQPVAAKTREATGVAYAGSPRWRMGVGLTRDIAGIAVEYPKNPPGLWALVEEVPYERYVKWKNDPLKTEWLTCKYGPKADLPVSIMLWKIGARIRLSEESIYNLADGRFVDEAIEHCPSVLADALRYYGPTFDEDYKGALARVHSRLEIERQNQPAQLAARASKAHAAASQAGLRFATMYFGDHDVKNTVAEISLGVSFDAKEMLNTSKYYSGVWPRSVPEVMQGERPPAVSREIRNLMGSGQQLLHCGYTDITGADSLREFGGSAFDIHFWEGTRPASISATLAAWIESANITLVDVGIENCPRYAGQALALAQGITGDRAKRLAAEAQQAAVSREAEKMAEQRRKDMLKREERKKVCEKEYGFNHPLCIDLP